MQKFKSTIVPVKGLYVDGQASTQPENTYRFALNAINNSSEGEEGFLVTELGNTSSFEIPEGYVIIGHLALANDGAILFLVSPTTERAEIAEIDKYGNYTTLVSSNDLEFSIDRQIEATLSTVKGCERVIYFCTPKLYAINIDNLETYLKDGETITTANSDGNGWAIASMRLFPTFERASIDSISVDETGGNLPLGTYNVILSYSRTGVDAVGWMDFSMPIPITDESFVGDFNQLDGGLNSVLPPTSKAIRIAVSNLDTSFPYIKVGVVASNDSVRTGYIVDTLELLATDLDYIITTISGEDVEAVPINQLTVGSALYEEAKTINQIDNRLLIGNLKEKDIDFAVFQQAANDIKTHWFTKELEAESGDNHYKSPGVYADYRSYMSNEVYSLGIVYIFKDGYETPVFHIPGRTKNTGYQNDLLSQYSEVNIWHNRPAPQGNWDSSLLTVGTHVTLADVSHLGFADVTDDIGYGAGLVPRWKVCNTATRYTTPATGYYSEGEMAYWESTAEYPSSLDCNGDRVYPEGVIRHHKMPDNILTPHALFDETVRKWNTYPLGIKFTNIEYPAAYSDDIIGYKIVREKRNAGNSSVIDKALMGTTLIFDNNTTESLDDYLFQPWAYNYIRYRNIPTKVGMEFKHATIHSPLTKFQRNALGSTHLKLEQKLLNIPTPTGTYIEYFGGIGGTASGEYRSYAHFTIADQNTSYIPGADALNRKVDRQAYVDADTVLDNYFDYKFNNTEQQETFVVSCLDQIPLPDTTQTTLASGDHTYTNLHGITEMDRVYFQYIGLEKYLPSQYGGLNSAYYIPVSNTYRTGNETEEFGGDIFISRLYFKKHAIIEDDAPVNHDNGSSDYLESHLISFFVESTINCGLRHEGEAETEVYYPKSYIDDLEAFLDFERTINGTWESDLIPNYYAYNLDFSAENDVKIYIPLSSTYDYCSTCSNDYHTRIAYSEQKSLESTADEFTSFLVNNYRDLPQNKGDITKLFVHDHNLFAHLENTLFQVPTNPKQLTTTDDNVFVGVNDFMAIDPVEVKSVNEGYLGTTNQWAHLTTEFGTFFVSEDAVYLLADGLNEISSPGMRKFFRDNKLRFPDAFRELLLDFSSSSTTEFDKSDSPASYRGVGWIACFDRELHRIILHKRDFDILFGLGTIDSPVGFWGTKNTAITYLDGAIVLNADTGWFEQYNEADDKFLELELSNTELFQNKSITISYDVKNHQWVSFHSYLPQYIFNTYNKWYSTKLDITYRTANLVTIPVYTNTAWEHNAGDYLNFYDTLQSHIIELVTKETPGASVTKSAEFVSLTREFNTTYNQWRDIPNVTFTRSWLYNDSQSTGILDNIITNGNDNPFISILYTTDSTYLYKADKTWRFNNFRDFVSPTATVPFISSSWTDLQSDYFIDKLPNVVAHDTTQSQYQVKKFRDKYLVMRLFFDPATDLNYKLLTQFASANQKESIR